MDYKIYSKLYLLNSLIEKRTRGYKAYLLMVQFGYLKAGMIYEPEAYMKGNQHIDFHALSVGWEAFTETGYKSINFGLFKDVGSTDIKLLTHHDMHEFLKVQCGSKINLESPPPAQIELL